MTKNTQTKHIWGPWISNPKLWQGEGHRICSCGKIQWADHPDPHNVRTDKN